MADPQARVGIVMGSDSDWPVMKDAGEALAEFDIAHEADVVSAHRMPEQMLDYGRQAAGRGLQVIIAGAGGAAHLPGMLASVTPLPVIGVPVPLKYLCRISQDCGGHRTPHQPRRGRAWPGQGCRSAQCLPAGNQAGLSWDNPPRAGRRLFCYACAMRRLVHQDGPAGLERSCRAGVRDWISLAPLQPGLERLEARFAGHGYDPHRHDVYAVGLTLAGIQEFEYRGATLRSLPGQVVVLHPDEMHDGRAGSDAGFRYRMAYIEPALIQAAIGSGRGVLPFVDGAVLDSTRLRGVLAFALDDLERPLEDLARDQFIVGLAEALCALDRSMPPARDHAPHRRAVAAARDYLEVHAGRSIGSHELETVTGLGRYALARQFRACYGTESLSLPDDAASRSRTAASHRRRIAG